MRFLVHALVIFGVLFGSDLIANNGAETQKLVRELRTSALWNEVKVRNYQAAATLKQEIYAAKPQLALARIDD
jgi:hypothetical protein